MFDALNAILANMVSIRQFVAEKDTLDLAEENTGIPDLVLHAGRTLVKAAFGLMLKLIIDLTAPIRAGVILVQGTCFAARYARFDH